MAGLLPHIDPDGLLEFSVVYTDRALNHMSKRFGGVMTDISRMLKQVYQAHSVALVPGSGTFGMESVARQFATDKHVMVIRNGWFSFRWTQIFDMGRIPKSHTVLKARRVSNAPQAAWTPAPIDEVRAAIAAEKPEALQLIVREARALEQAFDQAGFRRDEGALNFSLSDRQSSPATSTGKAPTGSSSICGISKQEPTSSSPAKTEVAQCSPLPVSNTSPKRTFPPTSYTATSTTPDSGSSRAVDPSTKPHAVTTTTSSHSPTWPNRLRRRSTPLRKSARTVGEQ